MTGVLATAVLLSSLTASAAFSATVQATTAAAPGLANMPHVGETMTMWDYHGLTPAPEGTNDTYSFLKYIELFTATGGCYVGYPGCSSDRDLLVDPANPGAGFNYTALITSLRAIVASGFTPHIITGNVPVHMSAAPSIGGFGFNAQPAADWHIYRAYIGGLAAASVSAFGRDAVSSWRWGVLTEYNNADWYVGPADAYFDLYDYTACGLADVLGTAFTIGAHMCTQCFNGPHTASGGWDPLLFLDHAAFGNNSCTGQIGVQVNYLSNSFYETRPEAPGNLSWVSPNMQAMVQRALANGLVDRGLHFFGVDEGRLLFGPAWEGNGAVPIPTRAIGHSYQGTFDALFFAQLIRNNVSYYSRWGVNTDGGNGLWTWNQGGVDTIATNVARLFERMQDERTGAVSVTQDAPPVAGAPAPIVDALFSTASDGNGMHLLIAHHHPWLNWTVNATVSFSVCGLSGLAGPTVSGRAWHVDDSCGNFWPTWWQDRATLNLSQYNQGWSAWGESLAFYNSTQETIFRTQLAPGYARTANLSTCMAPWQGSVSNNCITGSLNALPHSVWLIEATW